MVNSALRPDASLGEVLADAARSTSDVRLAVAAGGGLVASTALGYWQPTGWFYGLTIALCVTAFGVWGIADRELHALGARAWPIPRPILVAIRILAAAVAAISVSAFLAALLGVGLGVIIS